MMQANEIQDLLFKSLPGAEVTVDDLTGTQDHWQVIVLWPEFRGKGLIEQHKIVHEALKVPMEDGRIHALKIKTYVPS